MKQLQETKSFKLVTGDTRKRKKKDGKCLAYRCCKSTRDGSTLCHRHIHIRHKDADPVGYTYKYLKQNARRRGKVFTLTIEDFREFVAESGYMETKGRTKRKFSIDRIDNSKGYEKGNIRLLTVSANASKGNKEFDDAPF